MADEDPAPSGKTTKLMPQQEQEYQAAMKGFDPAIRNWMTKFATTVGEKPNTETDPTFDYRKAYRAGDRPVAVEGDTIPHWPSTGKSEDHPTEWKNLFMQKFGVDHDTIDPKDRTPEMTEWVRQNMPIGSMNEAIKQIVADPRLLEALDAIRRSSK